MLISTVAQQFHVDLWFLSETLSHIIYQYIYLGNLYWTKAKPESNTSLPEQAYIPIEKIIRTSKQSASTS